MTLPPLRRTAIAVLMALIAALLSLGLAACGDDDSSSDATTAAATTAAGGAALPAMTKATLVLDFLPNAVHAGIYRAVAQGYYTDNNIDLQIIQPTSTADTLKLIDAGKADIGIADGIDIASQISEGRDAQAIGAVVQRPLGGLIALEKSGITDPKQFEGTTVGVTGVPSDTAILNTIVSNAGGDPAKVKVVTIGFNGVQNLENNKVKAFTGFWPADGVQVQEDGYPTTIFKLDENGGPAYPGLVYFSTQKKIAADPALLAAFMDATVKGYDDVVADPKAGLADLLKEEPTLDPKITEAQLTAYEPLFVANAPSYGVLQTEELQKLSDYLVAQKLITAPITPERFGTDQFLPSS